MVEVDSDEHMLGRLIVDFSSERAPMTPGSDRSPTA
jgi:hypothetical protein